MWSVVASLVPVVGASVYYFGPSAVLVIGAATLGAVLAERAFGPKGALRDGSATITGLLLGLTLPPGLPVWMAFLGGAFGIGFGKLIFGGLGQNIFNPALLGRAFLQAAFPVAMTTWPALGGNWWSLRGDNLALPLMSPQVPDGLTGATPLGLMKFEQVTTEYADLMIGSIGGSLGETSGVIILLAGAYLALRNHLNWRIPASILMTVAVLAGLIHVLSPERYPTAMFMLFSGFDSETDKRDFETQVIISEGGHFKYLLDVWTKKNLGKYQMPNIIWLKNISIFTRLVLRNSGDDWPKTFFVDPMMQELTVEHMKNPYQAYQPAIVYINGQYWGIHNMRQKFITLYLFNIG